MPVLELVLVENVVREINQLSDLILDTVKDTVDSLSTTRHLLEVRAEDLLELLKHFTGFEDVTEDGDHVLRLGEYVLGVRELPTVHGVGNLDLLLGLIVLLLPVLEHADGLVDLLDRIRDWLFVEDLLDVDLLADFGADLV